MRSYRCTRHNIVLDIDDETKTYNYTHGKGQVQATCYLLGHPEPETGPQEHEHRGYGGQVAREICQIEGG